MTRGVRLKSIALPFEHGGWGFLFEPLLLALPVAGSLAGICLASTAGSAFLLRQPLELFLRSTEPVAPAGVAPAIALAGGWSAPAAAALWGMPMARSIPSIFYVRVRLRLDRAQNAGVRPASSMPI